ncbi:MAG TPA: spore coat protein YlbD [Haloplasmataceae bacterium]
MDQRIEQFKSFVRRHPKLRQLVRSGEYTWQALYEEWVLLGEEDPFWKAYRQDEADQVESGKGDGQEFIRQALNYVKRLNPDDITKYINNIQKVLSLIQMLNGGKRHPDRPPMAPYRPRRPIDPLFRRYDEYE